MTKQGRSSKLWALPAVGGYVAPVWFGAGAALPWWGKVAVIAVWAWAALKAVDAFYEPR